MSPSTQNLNRRLTCYISWPQGVQIENLRLVLRESKVRTPSIGELVPAGVTSADVVRTDLERTDFVCGVLSASFANENVLFDLGLAIGLGKPVFIIAEGSRLIPSSLASYPFLIAKIDETKPIAFHLKYFLKNLSRKSPRVAARYNPPTLSTSRRSRKSLQSRVMAIVNESQAEDLLLEAFKSAGIEAIAEPNLVKESGLLRPDLVAWLPNSPKDLGNPIIIEFSRMDQNLEPYLQKLRESLRRAKVRTGLLVTIGPIERASPKIYPDGYIFILALHDLVDRIHSGSLIQLLISERNRSFHSAG
jgi:hypothetical protein